MKSPIQYIISLTLGKFFHAFLLSANFFQNQLFLKIPSESNSLDPDQADSLDPDQAQCFVGPDLVPNCLQMSSADDTRRQKVKVKMFHYAFKVDIHVV